MSLGGWVRIAGALAATLLLALPQGRAETITLQADEWCPYNCQPGTERPGYAVEIAADVFRAGGDTVEYRIAPWTRTIADLRQGSITGAIGASGIDANGLVIPREPIGWAVNVVAVRRGEPLEYRGPESLAGRRIGVIAGYSYGEALDAAFAGAGLTVEAVSGDRPVETNLRKLLAGRIDALIEDRSVLVAKLAELGLADQVEMVPVDRGEPIYIAFSPADPQAASRAGRLDAGIAELRRTGRLAVILARYGLSDWQ